MLGLLIGADDLGADEVDEPWLGMPPSEEPGALPPNICIVSATISVEYFS